MNSVQLSINKGGTVETLNRIMMPVSLKKGQSILDNIEGDIYQGIYCIILSKGILSFDNTITLYPGDMLLTKDIASLVCLSKICHTLLISNDIDVKIDKEYIEVIRAPSSKYYNKYSASISSYENEILSDVLYPWTLYLAEVGFVEDSELHIHKELVNYLYFIDNDSDNSLLVYQSNLFNHAMPIIPGDLAIVKQKVVHNVANLDISNKLKFVVINDSPSKYEQPNESDYHNIMAFNKNELHIQQRDITTPIIVSLKL